MTTNFTPALRQSPRPAVVSARRYATTVSLGGYLFNMKFLERDLEQIIMETDNEELCQRGLDIYGKKIQQTNIGAYGISDIICLDKEVFGDCLNIEILELKKGALDDKALVQGLRYARGVQKYLEERKFIHFRIKLSLIGSEMSMGDMVFLTDLIFGGEKGYLTSINFYTYKYEFDGITFNRCDGWFKTKGFGL